MSSISEDLALLRRNGQFRKIPDIDFKTDGKVVINGIEYINFASNDYLGISTKTDLIDEFLNEYKHELFSSASARLLSGTSREFKELESTAAKIFNKEAFS